MYYGNYTNSDLNYIYDYIKTNRIYESFIYFNNTDDSSATKDSIKFYRKYNKLNLE